MRLRERDKKREGEQSERVRERKRKGRKRGCITVILFHNSQFSQYAFREAE